MTDSISPKWYNWAFELEESHNCSVEAGLFPHQFEKLLEQLAKSRKRHFAPLTFYYFVHFSRRKRGLSVKDLSQKADIDFAELMGLERDTQFKLKPESVVNLAKFFGVDEYRLHKMAKLDKPRRDPNWEKPAVQFPDKVGSTEELGDIEFVVLMSIKEYLAKQEQKSSREFVA